MAVVVAPLLPLLLLLLVLRVRVVRGGILYFFSDRSFVKQALRFYKSVL